MTENVANNVANEKVQDYVKKSHNMTENEQKKEKTTQDVQKNCLSLTEQFFDDEIDESKLYYFKQKMSEEIEIGHPFSLNMVRAMDDTYLDWFLIDKVLAPVPSYDLFVELTEKDKENTKLKDLLIECKEAIEKAQKNYGYDDSIVEILEPVTNKIDEVLK